MFSGMDCLTKRKIIQSLGARYKVKPTSVKPLFVQTFFNVTSTGGVSDTALYLPNLPGRGSYADFNPTGTLVDRLFFGEYFISFEFRGLPVLTDAVFSASIYLVKQFDMVNASYSVDRYHLFYYDTNSAAHDNFPISGIRSPYLLPTGNYKNLAFFNQISFIANCQGASIISMDVKMFFDGYVIYFR